MDFVHPLAFLWIQVDDLCSTQELLCRRCKFERNCWHLHSRHSNVFVFSNRGGAGGSRGGRVGGGVAVRNGEWRKAARVGGWPTVWRGSTRWHRKRCSCCLHVCVNFRALLCGVLLSSCEAFVSSCEAFDFFVLAWKSPEPLDFLVLL